MVFPKFQDQEGIYILTNILRTPQKKYVGSSDRLRARTREHLSSLRRGGHSNRPLQRDFDKYGEEAFTVQVLEYCSVEQLIERETAHVLENNTMDMRFGYNLVLPTRHGRKPTGRKGIPLSDEQRVKISKSLLGVKKTPEHSANMSAARMGKPSPLRGRTRDPEVGLKISEARKGKPLTEEHRRHLSKAQTGVTRKRAPMTKERKAELAKERALGIRPRRRPLTDEHKARMAEGRRRYREGKLKKKTTQAE
jgi:group I intron endonuclease